MKSNILHFINSLSLYDFLLFGGILFFFLFFLILAVLFHQKLTLALTFVIMALLLLLSTPLSYLGMHTHFYKHRVTLTTVQDLEFTDILVIRGDINNTSKKTFQECTLMFGVSKISPIKPLNLFYPYLPFRRKTMVISKTIKPQEGESFKLLIEPFSYPKKFTVIAWSFCR